MKEDVEIDLLKQKLVLTEVLQDLNRSLNKGWNSNVTNDVILGHLGFSLDRRASLIPGAGDGVFIERGHVKKGSLVAMYPGNDCYVYFILDPRFT